MGTETNFFLEVIEWFDSTGQELLHRIPERGSGEIKFGAQLTVRESQAAVLFYQGRAYDAFGPGRHTLKTANLPILTKVLSAPWGFTSPLRAEVVFVNMKVFPNLRWGTRDPVAFKDAQLGLIRLRAFGVFNLRVVQPVLFINRLAGTQGIYTTADVEEYLSRVIVSRFNDHLGEHLDSLLSLPGRYDELSGGLTKRLQEDFAQFGLALSTLYIDSITPPEEVQRAIDDKSRMNIFDDMNKLLRLKAAMAIEKASESQAEAGAGMGMGVGMGLLMPAMLGGYLKQGTQGIDPDAEAPVVCGECSHPVPPSARFCPACGHQQLVFDRCSSCSKNLPPNASFCPRCGKPVSAKPQPKVCSRCGTENLANSVYCNQCGEKLG